MNRIKELRKNKGITITKISEELHMPQSTLTNYENGKRAPRDKETWQKLADYFDVSIAYIMGVSEEKTSLKNIKNKINENAKLAFEENFENDDRETEFWNLISKIKEIEEKETGLKPDVIKDINFSKLAPDSEYLLFGFQSLNKANQTKLVDYLRLLSKSQDFDDLLDSLRNSEKNE